MLLGEPRLDHTHRPLAHILTRYGWGNTVLAFVGIALGIPAPFALWKWGPALRQKSKYAAGD